MKSLKKLLCLFVATVLILSICSVLNIIFKKDSFEYNIVKYIGLITVVTSFIAFEIIFIKEKGNILADHPMIFIILKAIFILMTSLVAFTLFCFIISTMLGNPPKWH